MSGQFYNDVRKNTALDRGDYAVLAQKAEAGSQLNKLMDLWNRIERKQDNLTQEEFISLITEFPGEAEKGGMSLATINFFKQEIAPLLEKLKMQCSDASRVEAMLRTYDELCTTVQNCIAHHPVGFTYIKIDHKNEYRALLEIKNKQGYNLLSDEELCSLIGLHSPKAPGFMNEYQGKVVPLLSKLQKLRIHYTQEEKEAQETLGKFWRKHGGHIRGMLSQTSYGISKTGVTEDWRTHIEELLVAAAAISKKNKNTSMDWNMYEIEPEKLREILTGSMPTYLTLRDVVPVLDRGGSILAFNKVDEHARVLWDASADATNMNIFNKLHNAKMSVNALNKNANVISVGMGL